MDTRSREQQLLCSIVGCDGPTSALLEGLPESAWRGVLDLATGQRLLPLVHARLSKMDRVLALPTGVQEMLRNGYYRSLLVNTRRFHKMLKALRALLENQVPVIPLKGAYLAPVVYGDLAVRSNVDYDLLVRRGDLGTAVEVLERLGFAPAKRFSMDVQIASFRHLPALTKDDHLDLQLHWNIADPGGPFSVDADGLWARAQESCVESVEVPCLSPEDLLLHLCLHASYMHRFFQGVRMLCDVAETLRTFRQEMDWEKVRRLAAEWGVERCICVTLHLVREFLGADVPDEALAALETEGFDLRYLSWARQLVFADASMFDPRHAKLAKLGAEGGIVGALKRLLRSVFPTRKVLAKMYPAHPSSPRILLYYPVRWKDLVSRYAVSVWRLARGERRMVSATESARRTNAFSDWLAGAS